jgi:hypothetical protein
MRLTCVVVSRTEPLLSPRLSSWSGIPTANPTSSSRLRTTAASSAAPCRASSRLANEAVTPRTGLALRPSWCPTAQCGSGSSSARPMARALSGLSSSGHKTALRYPASGRGPWAPRDRERRTASAPGRDGAPRGSVAQVRLRAEAPSELANQPAPCSGYVPSSTQPPGHTARGSAAFALLRTVFTHDRTDVHSLLQSFA